MKILKIRFKNINSFYGKTYTVDFTAPPLSQTGLFIISGPTGAGKSTLLDVVTLALYNEVPRFGRGISKTEIEKLGSIVNSRAADEPRCEAFAEVEFEVASGQYRSSWSIAKNRNGNWNNYQMEIAQLPDETLLEIKALGDYPKKNTELIGLNYGQFVKSIVLAQGSFAEFLKADKHTRTKLLEDITGTHIYRRLGEQAFERFKESAAQIRVKEEVMKGVELKSEEEIALLGEQRTAKELSREKTEQELQKWENEKALVAEITALERVRINLDKEKTALDREEAAFENKQSMLRQHESVSHLVEPITRFEELQKQVARITEEIASRKQQGEKLEDERGGLLKRAGLLTGIVLQEDDFVAGVNRFESEILAMEGAIKELRAQAKPVSDALGGDIKKAEYGWASSLTGGAFEQNLTVLTTVKPGLEAVLATFPDDLDAANRLKMLDEEFELLAELKNLFTEKERLGTEGKKTKSQLDSARELLEKTGPLLEVASRRLVGIKAAVEEKTRQLITETSRKSFDEQREQLEDGQPCPLCGSSHHPFLHAYVNKLSTASAELTSAKGEEKQAETEERALALQVETARRKTTELSDVLSQMRSEYKAVDAKAKDLMMRVVLPNEGVRDDVLTRLKNVQDSKAAIEKWKAGKEEYLLVLRLENYCRQLMEVRNEVVQLESRRQQRYSGNNIQTDVKDLLGAWGRVLSSIEENKSRLTQLEGEAGTLQKELGRQQDELLAALEALGMMSVDDARRRLLAPATYKQLRADGDKLRERLQSLSVQAADNRFALAEKTQQRQFPQMAFEDLEARLNETKLAYRTLLQEVAALTTTLQNDSENRLRFDAMRVELGELRKEHARWELLKQYIGDAAGNLFSSFAQSLTLSNLIGLANARLQKLSERYILDKPRNDSDGLYVLDTYHGNQARAVSTLSGGETFTVSLALALALSDLASRNVRIESLFIDEGFGTLDAETLESAVTILERLQDESRKTVGVISHRQEMKERIPVQIQVEKGADGASNLKITG